MVYRGEIWQESSHKTVKLSQNNPGRARRNRNST
jgi:hypothetical protein